MYVRTCRGSARVRRFKLRERRVDTERHSQTMPKPSHRETILTEGLRVVLERGFCGASVRDVVQARRRSARIIHQSLRLEGSFWSGDPPGPTVRCLLPDQAGRHGHGAVDQPLRLVAEATTARRIYSSDRAADLEPSESRVELDPTD